jgi:5-methylcytosine-specific restriction endonuclease McrBC regulatory subunit McrC
VNRTEYLTESETAAILLTDGEAAALAKVGMQLASDRDWWGEDAQEPTQRAIIRCSPLGRGQWSVRVQDAVGVVSIGSLQLLVSPKVPMDHLVLLFSEAIQVPRLADQSGWAAAANSMWEVVARWFVLAVRVVLRRDLSRDYQELAESLPEVRGRIEHFKTARAFCAGRLEMHCVFDEFTIDTPINRLLRAAARAICGSTPLSKQVRRDAAQLVVRMTDVGEFRPTDLLASPERRTAHYSDAVALAKQILKNTGRTIAAGDTRIWTFLIRTPELVEAGVRSILQRELTPITVTKKGRRLARSLLTVNPDLVFDKPLAVGDVKYKLAAEQWNRADLYEVVAFAEEFRTPRASLLSFGKAGGSERSSVTVGDIQVERIIWDVVLPPQGAAKRLCSDMRRWLTA